MWWAGQYKRYNVGTSVARYSVWNKNEGFEGLQVSNSPVIPPDLEPRKNIVSWNSFQRETNREGSEQSPGTILCRLRIISRFLSIRSGWELSPGTFMYRLRTISGYLPFCTLMVENILRVPSFTGWVILWVPSIHAEIYLRIPSYADHRQSPGIILYRLRTISVYHIIHVYCSSSSHNNKNIKTVLFSLFMEFEYFLGISSFSTVFNLI